MPNLRNSTLEGSTGRARRPGLAVLRHEARDALPIQLGASVDDLFEVYVARWSRATPTMRRRLSG